MDVSYYAGWINSVINVNRLQVILPPTVAAGKPFGITVTAVNAYGMAVTGYQGTITFSTSDPRIMAGVPFNFESDLRTTAGTRSRWPTWRAPR